MLQLDDKSVSQMIADLELDLKNIPAQAMQQAAEILRLSFEQNFIDGGRWNADFPITPMSGGSMKWKPLAESTKQTYAALGKNTERTLQRTAGGLAAGIEVYVGTDNTILIRSNKDYSAAQQFGVTNTVRVTAKSRK